MNRRFSAVLRLVFTIWLCPVVVAEAATISGVVRDADTSAPLALATVTIGTRSCLPGWPCSFFPSGTAVTQPDGSYSIGGLTAGTYVVVASMANRASSTYPGVRCYHPAPSNCGAESPPGVSIPDAGASITGIDVPLYPGGVVEGDVRGAASGTAIPDAAVTLTMYDGSGQRRAHMLAISDAQGHYRFGELRDGNFAIVVRGPSETDYVGAIYPATPCDNFSASCEPSAALAQPIALSQALAGLDVPLLVGGRVRVTLRDSLTGAPIAQQVRMRLASNPSVYNSGGSSVANPERFDFGPIAPTNVLLTFAYLGSPDYGNELYDEVPCLNDTCNFTAGTAIAVAAGALVQIDETLDPQRIARGRVVDAFGQPVADVEVAAGYGGPGGLVAHFVRDFIVAARNRSGGDGRFVLSGFGSGGEWWVRTLAGGGFIDGAAPGIQCNTANLFCKGSAPYTLLDFSSVSEIDVGDIVVSPGARIRGTVMNAATGLPATFGSVFVVDPTTRALALQGKVAPNGHYELGHLPAGSYLLLGESVPGPAEIYQGVPCTFNANESTPACSFAGATPVGVNDTQVLEGVDFFGVAPLFANGFEG